MKKNTTKTIRKEHLAKCCRHTFGGLLFHFFFFVLNLLFHFFFTIFLFCFKCWNSVLKRYSFQLSLKSININILIDMIYNSINYDVTDCR